MTDPARISELMLENLFADLGLLAFHMCVPERPPAVSGIDVALVRDGQIAELHTLLPAQGLRGGRVRDERREPTSQASPAR